LGGALHQLRAALHEAKTGFEAEDARGQQRVVFAEAMTGDDIRRRALDQALHPRERVDDVHGGLRESGHRQTRVTIVEAEILDRVAKDRLRPVGDAAELVEQRAPHAAMLGALTGKEIRNHRPLTVLSMRSGSGAGSVPAIRPRTGSPRSATLRS